MRPGERLHVVGVAGDQSLGPHFLREGLEIELVDRTAEAVRIVQHEHAALGRLAPEQYADVGRPGHRLRVERRVAAQHQHVDVLDVDRLGLRRRLLHRLEEGGMVLVLAARREAGVDAQLFVAQRKVGRGQIADSVAAQGRGMCKHRRRVIGELAFHVVDEEGDQHAGSGAMRAA